MKAVTIYRPSVLENAMSGFDRYLDSFFGDNFLTPSDRIFNRLPSVDVRKTEKAYVLEAELPGFDEKDIEIRLDGSNLTIESKKTENKESAAEAAAAEAAAAEAAAAEFAAANSTGAKPAAENYLIRERRVSSFSRSFKLPENADPEGISASFRNGILSLEIKKKAEAQTRVIRIS